MKSLFLGLALQAIFPIFSNPAPDWGSVSLLNKSSEPAEFVVRLNSTSGSETGSRRLTVPAGAVRHVAIEELLPGSSALPAGWVSVESSTADFKTHMAMGTAVTLAAAEPAYAGDTTVYLPDLRVLRGFRELNETDTTITVVNPTDEPADVTLTLISHDDGVSHVKQWRGFPSRHSMTVQVSDLLPGASAFQFSGHAVIRSTSPVAAWEQISTPLSWSSLRGKGAGELEATTTLASPFFVTGFRYESVLNLMNASDSPIRLVVEGFDSRGARLGDPARLTLEPGRSISREIQGLLGIVTIAGFPGPVISGSLRVRELDGRPFRAAGSVATKGFDQQFQPQAAMLQWLISQSLVWEIPYATLNEQYYSAYAVSAANEWLAVQTEVHIEVYGLDGNLVQRLGHSISPRGSEAEVIKPGAPAGYVRIWSPLPIVVIGTIGSADGRSFEVISGAR